MTAVLRRVAAVLALPVTLLLVWWFASADSTKFYAPSLERILKAFPDTWLWDRMRDDFLAVTAQAERLVAEQTGLHAPTAARSQVVDRASWVSANVRSTQRLLEPLTARVGQRMAGSPVAPLGRRIAGTETGVLLGYLAQRVLGQYDLLVVDDEGSADAVYYVGGNILALEKRYAFRPRDFRLWIAIHECTHRAQFTAVSWMKPYYLSLVNETLASIDPDPRRLVQALARAAEELRNGRNPLDDGGLVALLATAAMFYGGVRATGSQLAIAASAVGWLVSIVLLAVGRPEGDGAFAGDLGEAVFLLGGMALAVICATKAKVPGPAS